MHGGSKGNLVFADYYYGDVDLKINSDSSYLIQRNLMPLIKNNKIAGIMYYGMESHSSYAHTDESESVSDTESNHHTHRAKVFWSDDFSRIDLASGNVKSDITIDCSEPLIDEKDVFRYTIQNAFDNNPATSYVEDTEDDLMYVCAIKPKRTKFAIINGYAANESLYFSNNRIIEVADEWTADSKYPSEKLLETNNRYELRDNGMSFQVGECKTFSNGYIFVSKISKGKKIQRHMHCRVRFLQ